MPSDYGVNKHPCFFCRKAKRTEYRQIEPSDLENIHESVLNANDPIKFEHLTKKFGSFAAVKNLSFSIREGEVFTFLGHNGAGKTTTINMMTGMLSSSSGDCNIYGYSIKDSMDTIQKNLGLCQQFDVLYDLLTVREHLRLVCELKNLPIN
jgi:ATP-binding cassette, subfamily A (ABC1), member 3